MTSPTSRVCGCCGEELHGLRAGHTVCALCEDRVRGHLRQVRALWPDLPGHLLPGRSGGALPPGPPGSRPPGRLEVLDLLGAGGVPDRLVVHEDAWRRARGLTMTPFAGNTDQRLAATVRFLLGHLEWACRHYDGVDDLEEDLRRVLGQMRAAAGLTEPRPDPPADVAVPCPEGGCGVRLQFDPVVRELACPACGTVQPTVAWLALGA